MSKQEKKPENENIMVVGEFLSYDLDCYKTKRNNNVVVVGGAGTGKTRGIVEPNILQATGSYVISDPKGNLYVKYKEYLESQGYVVKKLDFVHPEESIKYNMFQQTLDSNIEKSYANIYKLADTIVSLQHDGTRTLDPFWDECATLLLTSLIGYLRDYHEPIYLNFTNVVGLVNSMNVDEYEADKETILDKMFQDIEEKDPGSYALQMFKSFRVAAGRTLRSIQITLNALISRYANYYIDQIMDGNELLISEIGSMKTALFICASDTERTYDGLVNIVFTQIMDGLVAFADGCQTHSLPVPVRFIMDDFATNVRITDFPRMISSIRSRGISTMIILQAESQLEQYYQKDARTILSNCDTYVYMGGFDIETARSVAERANRTLHTILEMPVGSEWVFRRGEPAVFKNIIDLDKYMVRNRIELDSGKPVNKRPKPTEKKSVEQVLSERLFRFPNINTRLSDSYIDSRNNVNPNENLNSDTDSNSGIKTDSDIDSKAGIYADSNTDSNAGLNADSNAGLNADSNTDSDTDSDLSLNSDSPTSSKPGIFDDLSDEEIDELIKFLENKK